MERKVLVYKNDLKNKKNKTFNLESIMFDNSHVEKMFREKDLDSLEYRLLECKETGFVDLDLKHMDLISLPSLPDEVYNKLKHLFLGDNKLTNLNDITKFKSLETLDINNNLFIELPQLPNTLNELCCQSNKLTMIKSHRNLQKLDCAFNNIQKIEELPKLELLVCNDNKLESIPPFSSLKKLVCNNNMIKIIHNYSSLTYLNCIKNNITSITDIGNIEDLLISYNPIDNLPTNLPKIKYLEIIDTNIRKLYFYTSLKEVYSSVNQLTHMSKKYIVKNKRVHKDKLLIFEF